MIPCALTDVLLKKYIEDSTRLWENNVKNLRCEIIGSAIGTHAGPGAVAAAFFNLGHFDIALSAKGCSGFSGKTDNTETIGTV